MIVGVGIDAIEVERVRQTLERFGDRFLERVFTTAEVDYARSRGQLAQRLAARFAVKEAAMKALGTGWKRGVRWTDIEVRNEPSGKPVLCFYGKAAHFARALGVSRTHISLTHTQDQAMAVVILEAAGEPPVK